MYWKSEQLKKEMRIRERIQYHEVMLQKKRDELSKLYDKVHKNQKGAYNA